jgi:phosphate transport system substrate-binding protein
MKNHKTNNRQAITCTHCGYEKNPTTAVNCIKCSEPLNISLIENSNKVVKRRSQTLDDWLSNPWTIRLSIGVMFLFFSWLIYCLFLIANNINNSNETGIYSSTGNIENTTEELKLYNSMKDVLNVPDGTFDYGGGATFAALTAQGLHDAMTKAHPNFRLRYIQPKDGQPGGRTGVKMLIDGRLSLTLRGAPLLDADYKTAQERGFGLKQIPVALDMFVFFTHQDISIPGLSVDQLKDIYKGKLTNWKLLGGPDLPIVPFSRNPKDSSLLNEFLGKEAGEVGSKVQFVLNYTDAIRKVGSTPGGIAFGGAGPILAQQTIRPQAIARANTKQYVQPFINNGSQVNAAAIRDGSYPISRRFFIVFRSDGTVDELAANAYVSMLLSNEGQEIVQKAGLVPLRSREF